MSLPCRCLLITPGVMRLPCCAPAVSMMCASPPLSGVHRQQRARPTAMGDFGVRPSARLVGQICDVEIAGLGGHIAKALDIEASSDTEAGELAAIMLSDQRAYPGI